MQTIERLLRRATHRDAGVRGSVEDIGRGKILRVRFVHVVVALRVVGDAVVPASGHLRREDARDLEAALLLALRCDGLDVEAVWRVMMRARRGRAGGRRMGD